MTKLNFFCFVLVFGRQQQFTSNKRSEWDNLHESTKQNGLAVWGQSEKDLRIRYEKFFREYPQYEERDELQRIYN